MKLVVGLGNPGKKYAGTRHNVGFAVVDRLADTARWQERFQSSAAERIEGEQKVVFVKPLTFMNLSGRSVRQWVDFYQISVSDLLIVCDDFNLPLGTLRARARGTAGGHNGLKDIQHHLGTTEYARLRIGVGAPEGQDAVDFVLERFRPTEKPIIEEAIEKAVQAVGVWIQQGIEACMNTYNG